MKAFYTLPLMSGFAYDSFRIGVLFISELESMEADMDLAIHKGKLVVGRAFAKFEYHAGIMRAPKHSQYLGLDTVTGQFVMQSYPQPGFYLHFDVTSELDSRKRLSYNGVSKFVLCGDGSVGFMSDCEGARSISINFEDL